MKSIEDQRKHEGKERENIKPILVGWLRKKSYGLKVSWRKEGEGDKNYLNGAIWACPTGQEKHE